MQEEFPRTPSPDVMRADIYELERRRLEGKIVEIDTRLQQLREQKEVDSAKGEVALLAATRGEIEKQLNILHAHYQHGR